MWRRLRIVVVFVLTATTIAGINAPPIGASDNSTVCKWDFPWPRRDIISSHQRAIKYYVYTTTSSSSQFTSTEANRIVYGGNTWNEAGFNIEFKRVSTTGASTGGSSWHKKGTVSSSQNIATSRIYFASPSCNRDAGRPIVRVQTTWDINKAFYYDCKAADAGDTWDEYSEWCAARSYHDIHHISSHEFGHWMQLTHSGSGADTMYNNTAPGFYNARTLTSHDKDGGRVMYGCYVSGC